MQKCPPCVVGDVGGFIRTPLAISSSGWFSSLMPGSSSPTFGGGEPVKSRSNLQLVVRPGARIPRSGPQAIKPTIPSPPSVICTSDKIRRSFSTPQYQPYEFPPSHRDSPPEIKAAHASPSYKRRTSQRFPRRERHARVLRSSPDHFARLVEQVNAGSG
jgi:hypothetical protein